MASPAARSPRLGRGLAVLALVLGATAAPAQDLLRVRRDAGGAPVLDWTGSGPQFELFRALAPEDVDGSSQGEVGLPPWSETAPGDGPGGASAGNDGADGHVGTRGP